MSIGVIMATFAAVSQTFGLPPGLLSALCFVESSHRSYVVHKDDGKGNSVGICQLKLDTARTLGYAGTEQGLKNPKTNILYAGMYLSKQFARYDGNMLKAISAYNTGTYKEAAKFTPVNMKYVSRVLIRWGEQNQ